MQQWTARSMLTHWSGSSEIVQVANCNTEAFCTMSASGRTGLLLGRLFNFKFKSILQTTHLLKLAYLLPSHSHAHCHCMRHKNYSVKKCCFVVNFAIPFSPKDAHAEQSRGKSKPKPVIYESQFVHVLCCGHVYSRSRKHYWHLHTADCEYHSYAHIMCREWLLFFYLLIIF